MGCSLHKTDVQTALMTCDSKPTQRTHTQKKVREARPHKETEREGGGGCDQVGTTHTERLLLCLLLSGCWVGEDEGQHVVLELVSQG